MNGYLVRKVSFVMRGIDVDLSNPSAMSETQDDPIMAGLAPAASLPAIRHGRTLSGQQQIAHRPVVLVIAGERNAAMQSRGQIDRLSLSHTLPVELHAAVGAESERRLHRERY